MYLHRYMMIISCQNRSVELFSAEVIAVSCTAVLVYGPIGGTLNFFSPSKHLWKAEIDLSGSKLGAHLLEINARDNWWDYKGYRQILIGN